MTLRFLGHLSYILSCWFAVAIEQSSPLLFTGVAALETRGNPGGVLPATASYECAELPGHEIGRKHVVDSHSAFVLWSLGLIGVETNAPGQTLTFYKCKQGAYSLSHDCIILRYTRNRKQIVSALCHLRDARVTISIILTARR